MRTRCTIVLLLALAACSEAPAPGGITNAPAKPTEAIAVAPPPAAAPAASAPEGWLRARLAAASGGDIEFVVDTPVRLERAGPGRFRLVGTQRLAVVWLRCTPTAAPAEQPLEDAWLVLDGAAPARYTLRAGRVWDATVSGGCPGLPGTASVPMRVPGRIEASGTLAADGRAAGERRDGDLVWTWSLPTLP